MKFTSYSAYSIAALSLIYVGWAAASVSGQSPSTMAQDVANAVKRIEQYHSVNPVLSQRNLHIVYWTPTDREPIARYRERLTGVLADIRSFYLKEMMRLGLGKKTFSLAMERDGLLRIHLVRGSEPYARYHVQSGNKIRNECLPILREQGIDADKETIVLFCNMSNWDPHNGKMSQNSPYYAAGGLRSGTAWQVDSVLLDAKLIAAKQPLLDDGQYGRISVGKYNSIFVGGVCHELGHALGLPHNMERSHERKGLGTSLMGSGNRTYGDERRNEGRGSFLTLADGLRLASHPLFTASEKGIDLPASAKIEDVAIRVGSDGKSFEISGRVVSDPPTYAIIGYLDPSDGGDYDATTVTAFPDDRDAFVLPCSNLKPGKAGELRIVACQANGGRIQDQTLKVPYTVGDDGHVDLSSYLAVLKLSDLASAIRRKDVLSVTRELANLEKQSPKGNQDLFLVQIARSLAATIEARPGPAPCDAKGDSCWLSDSAAKDSKVGWLRPMANRLPDEDVLLKVGGKLFARGLYAHAPSTYTYDLDGKWKRLTGFAGLADGHHGSVVFSVVGDGKELWRSSKVTESMLVEFSLDVTKIRELSLRVEDAGDGASADWGVWTDVKIDR